MTALISFNPLSDNSKIDPGKYIVKVCWNDRPFYAFAKTYFNEELKKEVFAGFSLNQCWITSEVIGYKKL